MQVHCLLCLVCLHPACASLNAFHPPSISTSCCRHTHISLAAEEVVLYRSCGIAICWWDHRLHRLLQATLGPSVSVPDIRRSLPATSAVSCWSRHTHPAKRIKPSCWNRSYHLHKSTTQGSATCLRQYSHLNTLPTALQLQTFPAHGH